MANIIINNYCNQKCRYCFAWKNMEDKSNRREMSLKTFIYCLQHLSAIGDSRVRMLGGEPLLHSDIQRFLKICNKGGFYITLFSNLQIPKEKLLRSLDFGENFDYSKITINLNLNDRDFYTTKEINTIYKSLEILTDLGCDLVISYNVYEFSYGYRFIFETAEKFGITQVTLKPTNSLIGENPIIDTNAREYGKYLFEIIEEFSENFSIGFGCGLSKDIFSESEIAYMRQNIEKNFGWGCYNNGGRYDINTDGSVFRCFPLQSIYENISGKMNVHNQFFRNMKYDKLIQTLEYQIPKNKFRINNNENCIGNQMTLQLIEDNSTFKV